MRIQRHSHMLYSYRDVSISRMKRAQMKTKGDDDPLYLTVNEFLSLHTTLAWYCDVVPDTKSYREALIDLVYRKCTANNSNSIN